jgi:hypothetical protein
MSVRFTDFGGLFPAAHSDAKNGLIADVAHDVDLSAMSVRPWYTDKFVAGTTGVKSMYEIQGCCVVTDDNPCTSYGEGNPSPSCPEQLYRTKPGTKPSAATHAGACNNDWRDLSYPDFPAPTVVAPPVPNDSTLEMLYAVYTVTDDWGRESAPSAVSPEFYTNFGESILVSGFPTTYPNGQTIKIYVTRPTWASGNEMDMAEERSGYFLQAEFPIGPSSATVPIDMPGTALTTYDYERAPDDLYDLQSYRGGQLLGLSGNMVRASIKNAFHAWPRRFSIRFYGEAQRLIVGRNIAYVLTDEAPLAMRIPADCSGPSCFQSRQIDKPLPCASRRSAAMYGDTAIYATYDGLVALTGEEWKYFPQWDRDEWRRMRPDTIVGEVFGDAYFFKANGKTYRLDLRTDALKALTTISTDGDLLSFHASTRGHLLYSSTTGIHRWNEGTAKKTAKWARYRAAHGNVRYVSAMHAIAIGTASIKAYSDGSESALKAVVGHTTTRFRAARGHDFGVHITTQGEVSHVIIGSSINQVLS